MANTSKLLLLCLQKEAKRFLGALAKRCGLAGSAVVSVAQLYALADDLELGVPDFEAFLADLNEAGALGPLQTSCTLHFICGSVQDSPLHALIIAEQSMSVG